MLLRELERRKKEEANGKEKKSDGQKQMERYIQELREYIV